MVELNQLPQAFRANNNLDVPRDLVKAVENLIAELNNIGIPRNCHSVYIARPDGNQPHVIRVHIRGGHEPKWRPREKHFGFDVDYQPWPECE